jgi:hypothetical protein
MTELLAELLPYLAAIYVAEGVAVVRPFQRLFTSGLGRWFDVRLPGLTYLGLFPWTEVVGTQAPPFAVSGEALFTLPRWRREEPPVLDASDLDQVELASLEGVHAEQRWVKAGRRKLFRAASPGLAERFAAVLRAVQAAAPAERVGAAREALAPSGQVEKVRAVRRAQRPYLVALRVTCTLLFLALFVLLPLKLSLGPAVPLAWDQILRGVAVLYGWTLFLTALMLVRCGVPGGTVAGTVFQLLLMPPSTVRALSMGAREIYERFDPAAVAAVLMQERRLVPYARRELRGLEFSAERTAELGLGGFWTMRRAFWERALRDAKRSAAEVLGAPGRVAGDATRYCPVCSSEYARGEACSDCRVPLRPFGRAA